MKKTIRYLAVAGTIGLLSFGSQAYGAHSGGDVSLRDVDGLAIDASGGSTAPYSPKQTCARLCHPDAASADPAEVAFANSPYCADPLHAADCAAGVDYTGHDYESDFALAAKTQINRNGDVRSYNVPYPQHGVSSGYHFQQGRNMPWIQDQRDYYHQAEFTSSSGMYGKY